MGDFSFLHGEELSSFTADRKSVEKVFDFHSKSYGRFLKARNGGNQI